MACSRSPGLPAHAMPCHAIQVAGWPAALAGTGIRQQICAAAGAPEAGTIWETWRRCFLAVAKEMDFQHHHQKETDAHIEKRLEALGNKLKDRYMRHSHGFFLGADSLTAGTWTQWRARAGGGSQSATSRTACCQRFSLMRN